METHKFSSNLNSNPNVGIQRTPLKKTKQKLQLTLNNFRQIKIKNYLTDKKIYEISKFANTLRLPRNKLRNIQQKKYIVHQAFSILIMHNQSSALYAVLAFCVAYNDKLKKIDN